MSPQSLRADRHSCFNVTLPCFSNLFSNKKSRSLFHQDCAFLGEARTLPFFNELRGAQEEQIILCSRIMEQLKWPDEKLMRR